jgi:hypothetical protein
MEEFLKILSTGKFSDCGAVYYHSKVLFDKALSYRSLFRQGDGGTTSKSNLALSPKPVLLEAGDNRF